MTTYQLVPYVVSVSLRGKPDETTALDDLFAGGEQLSDELGRLLHVHAGKLVQDPSKAKRPLTLRVESVGLGTRQMNATMAPGRSGIASIIRKPTGAETQRDFYDTELIPLRHFLIYAAGAHRAILLAERVGGHGAITALSALVRDTWRSKHPGHVLNISAAAAEEVWATSLEQRPVKSWRFIKPATTNGNYQIGQHAVDWKFDATPVDRKARWSLKKKVKEAAQGGKPLSQVILKEAVPVLAPGSKDYDAAAAALLADGWQVAVNLELEGNVSRTVYVEHNAALSMSFPVIDGEHEPASRPEDADVLAAVKRIVGDGLLADWGVGPHHANGCTWDDQPCDDAPGWKVQWDVIDKPNQGSP